MKPRERIILSSVDPNTLRASYGIPMTVRIYGPWVNVLNNSGERITLRDRNKVPLCSVRYGDNGRWSIDKGDFLGDSTAKGHRNAVDELRPR